MKGSTVTFHRDLFIVTWDYTGFRLPKTTREHNFAWTSSSLPILSISRFCPYASKMHWIVATKTQWIGISVCFVTSSFRLFVAFDPRLLQQPTIQKFVPLLDNYNPVIGIPEKFDENEKKEIREFLDAILSTSVMRMTYKYLSGRGRWNLDN